MATGIWPTGRFAASGGVDRSVAVWDTRTGQAIAWIQTPHDRIEGVAASDDGTRRATTGSDGYVRVWDLRRGTQLWEVRHSADRLQFNVDARASQRAESYLSCLIGGGSCTTVLSISYLGSYVGCSKNSAAVSAWRGHWIVKIVPSRSDEVAETRAP